MTRHGWHEWQPDPRDEQRDLAEAQEELEVAMPFLAPVDWCEPCERTAPTEGCPACGDG